MIEWDLQPIFDSYSLVVVLSILAFLGLGYFKLDRQLSLGKRFVLTSLRFIIILLMILVALRPGLTWTSSQSSRQSVAVLVDTSASMELPSGINEKSRWEIELQVLSYLQQRRAVLGDEVDWKIFGYDSGLRSLVETTKGQPKLSNSWIDSLPKVPQGTITEVGKPFGSVLALQSDPPLMAMIWLGDGAQTARGDTSEAQQAARQFSLLDIPIYLVGIGPRSGAEETRDLVLDGVPDQSEAFAKNPFPVRGNLRAIGLQGRELTIAVFLRQPDGKLTRMEQTKLKPNQSDQTLPFNISVVAPDPGTYQLLVKAEGVEGEATLLNNEQTCFLNVPSSGSRLLFLEGQASAEQKFIVRGLADSPDLQIDPLWFPETARSKWPIDLGDRLQEDVYDCIILGDLDASALGPKNMERIIKLVENGTGLITLGGYHAYSSGGYSKSPLEKILPIELNPSDKQNFNQPLNLTGHWANELPLIPRAPHPILDLANEASQGKGAEAKGLEAWKSLRPLLGANRWKGVKQEAGIQILASGPQNEPLIVASSYGNGRLLCLAFDSSYRWWRQGKSELHRRFWRQAVLWTMRREDVQEGFQISMPKRTMSLGESTQYRIDWKGGSKGKPMPKEIEVRWTLDGEDRGPLLPQNSGTNRLDGELSQINKPGRYEMVVRAKNDEGQPLEARLPFVVVDMAVEKIQSSPDWQLINQLAKLNESAGGRVIAPESSDDIIRALQDRRRSFHVDNVQSFRLGENLADSWASFGIISLFFIVQWSLRKAWNLP
jgi:uncharacterized membrane protein